VLSTDLFYNESMDAVRLWADYGALALEMETNALYTLAARNRRRALTVLTVSDHVLTGEATTAAERETTLREMMEIALDTAVSNTEQGA
jgi:purine-nucleoside phosphorylase